ncbi:MAG: hypothetical protein NTW79_03120 [Candidatus Berkelbacteria bacterium]|nr:hypothetical protein [Candidatus Berkelbacteria bacterium]
MGIEQSGPSEEDLQIRPGEPEGRITDVDEARKRAVKSNELRDSEKYLNERSMFELD